MSDTAPIVEPQPQPKTTTSTTSSGGDVGNSLPSDQLNVSQLGENHGGATSKPGSSGLNPPSVQKPPDQLDATALKDDNATDGTSSKPFGPLTKEDTDAENKAVEADIATKQAGAVEVTKQEILIEKLSDPTKKLPVDTSFTTDADSKQAYLYMLYVADYEQKESMVNYFEKQTAEVRKKVMEIAVKDGLIPAKKTPAQEEAEEQEKAEKARKEREAELEKREAEAKKAAEENSKKGFFGKLWGGIKAGAKYVGNKIVDGAKYVGNKVVAGAKATWNGAGDAVDWVKKTAGLSKIEWPKLGKLVREVLDQQKNATATDPTAKPTETTGLEIAGYVKMGGQAAGGLGGAIADKYAGTVNAGGKEMSFAKGSRVQDGLSTTSTAQQASLGFSVANAGVGLLGDGIDGYKNIQKLRDADADKVNKASTALDLTKNVASIQSNVTNLVKASGDLTGTTGAVMSAAQLGMALGIGQIVSGTADLVKGILNVIDGADGRKKLNAMREKMVAIKDQIDPKMFAAIESALSQANNQILSGSGDILSGAAGIVGGALLLALGISNPIGMIIVGAAAVVGGVIAAYKWKKAADAKRKLVDEHPAFANKIEELTSKYRSGVEQDAKTPGDNANKDPFVKYIDDRAGVGDKVKGTITGGKDNDGPKEAIRRIVLQEHGFVDVDDYKNFHNETLGKYLNALIAKGDPATIKADHPDFANVGEIEAAVVVIKALGLTPKWPSGGEVTPKADKIAGKL